MEGVLVTARRAGSPISITVVSDEHGHFAFPPGRLAAGEYALTTRATGYEPARVANVVLDASHPASVALALSPAKATPHVGIRVARQMALRNF